MALFATTHCLTAAAFQEDPSIKLCVVAERNREAVHYVGTSPLSGRVQLELLLLEGLKKEHRVLEIGCGALIAAIPILSFLEVGHYVGIDPYAELIHHSSHVPENREVIQQKRPNFLYFEDFDASTKCTSFDYIISHAVMSHAAQWQLPLFLKNCSRVLKKGGKAIFSLRLTEPNAYGHEGALEETRSESWVHPDNTFFHKATVLEEAGKWFSNIEQKPEYTKLNVEHDAGAFHDWFVLTK